MAAPRLPAKLSRPRLSGVIDRARLFKLLDKERECPLLWVTGPPGAGKSTLVTTYLAHKRITPLWYRIDDGDADAATFFSYLAQGARALSRKKKLNLPALTPEYLLDLPGFARRFFRALFELMPANSALVLDAYESAAGSALDDLLAIAVAEVPDGVRLMVTSRTDPGTKLGHLTAKSSLALVPWEELRLTVAEAREIAVPAQCKAQVPVESLRALSDGWIAGFVVMLNQARGGGPPAPENAAREALFAYFVNEMFAQSGDAMRVVLVRTALMPAFTAAQAAALAPDTDAKVILQRLYRRHYFIDRSADAEPVYRYHALFRDFLLAQGHVILSPVERDRVQLEAARLLEAGGQREEAAAVLIDAKAWSDAARLWCDLAPALLAHGRNATLDKGISALPPAMLNDVPWLGYWLGMARQAFAPPVARGLLEAAYLRMEAAGDTTGRLLCCAGILDTYWMEWVDVRPIDRWGAIVASLIGHSDAFPNDEIETRVLASLGGLAFRLTAHADLLRKACARARALLNRTADRVQRLMLVNMLAWVYLEFGEWQPFGKLCAAEDAGFLDADLPPLHLICWYTVRCSIGFQSGEFAHCEREIERAQALADASGVHIYDALIASHAAYYAINARAPERAETLLARMQSALHPARKLDLAHYESLRAALALFRGEATQALQHARAATDLAVACGSDMAEAHCRLGIAMALIELGRPAEARSEVLHLQDFAARTTHLAMHYTGLMLTSLMLQALGDERGAMESLRAGLAYGCAHDPLVCGWMYPQIHDRLCPVALQAGIEVDYVRKLIRRLNIPAPATDIEGWPWPVRIHTLGRFEIEVNGAPLEFGRKTPRRLLQLIKWLIAQGGQASAQAAFDALWPDEEADAAANALDVALHRVRKLLGGAASIEFADGMLSMDRGTMRVDALAFEHALDAAQGEPGAVSRALGGYRGHFLPGDENEPWTISPRERLRARFVREAAAHGRALEAAREIEKAAAHYVRAIDIDDLAEVLYQGLMRCHLELGQRSEGIATYARLRRTLEAQLRIKPAAASDALLRALREA